MRVPGLLGELDPHGTEAWKAVVDETLDAVLGDLRRQGRSPRGLTTDLAEVPHVRAPDWPGFPARIGLCVGRRGALRLLDWRPSGEGDLGRARHQEEYLEWRLVRECANGGAIARIEMTTELREYWEVLAAQQPQTLLNLVAELAGVDQVDPEEVYGGIDLGRADEAARVCAFRRTMLPTEGSASFSALNDGREAICCMVQPTNTLSALLALGASAARPLIVLDGLTGRPRFASGAEAIEALAAAAQDGRHSDPVVVERVTSLTSDGRQVGFDDPIGVYIRGVQHHELAQPDGEDVPEEWFKLSRGVLASEAGDGRQRTQRLAFAVPGDADFSLSDLLVRRTGERLTSGGQLAALVQLTLYLRSGRSAEAETEPVGSIAPPPIVCEGVQQSIAEMAEP